jgi:hypothetical protein
MAMNQLQLLPSLAELPGEATCPSASAFPTTRYQGSKLKLLDWIWRGIERIQFNTCLDLFSGTGSVSYMLKVRGKAVSTNDCLRFNQTVARALVVNNGTLLSETKAKRILSTVLPKYDNFVERTFSGIYFTDTENVWLDRAIQNIGSITNRAERDLALFALYQACIAKRPYNLFHRANLYMQLRQQGDVGEVVRGALLGRPS